MPYSLRAANLTRALVFLSVFLLPGLAIAQATYTYLEDPSNVVVRYSRTPTEMEVEDRATTVTVYGNGRAVVYFPPHGYRQGLYQTTLSIIELDNMVATMVDAGMVEYDAAAIASARQSVLASQNMGFYIGDADISTMELNLSSYTPAGGVAQMNVSAVVTRSGLQLEARQFPGISSLARLAAAEALLLDIVNNRRLLPMRVSAGRTP